MKIGYFLLGCVFLAGDVFLLIKADKIRATKFWPLGWLTYLVLAAYGVNFLAGAF
jgi:hypothetical protein